MFLRKRLPDVKHEDVTPMALQISKRNLSKAIALGHVAIVLASLSGCQGVDAATSLKTVQITVPPTDAGALTGRLQPDPSYVSFGGVSTRAYQARNVMLTNDGGKTVSILGVSVSRAEFRISGQTLPLTIKPSRSVIFTVGFAPQSVGNVTGSVTITSNASNSSLILPVSGIGVSPGLLTASPTSLNFPSVTVGGSASLSETITNTGGTNITISQIASTGTGVSVSGIATPPSLNPSQSATYTVTFAPQSVGNVTGSVTITSNASNSSLILPVSGTALPPIGQLSVNPSTLSLGNVVLGTSGSTSGSLSASGASVTIGSALVSNSMFSLSGLSLPLTVAVGQSVPFTITFSPQVVGPVSAALTIASNAQSTITESLSGTGTPTPSHGVNLSWSASSSPEIVGYNVYRAQYSSACGSFSRINSALITGTLYTDFSVAAAGSYCYAVTSMDTDNLESGYSNIASDVLIPAS